jgi:DNA-binding LytR/AlgR family response regulator
MKILIAEDEAVIAESVYQVLIQLGYEPEEPVDNSTAAINAINNKLPDLVIVDIHMGAPYSGFKVAEVLQQKNIPFIFLTALYDMDTVSRAKLYNPSSYLVKPFTKENLFTNIELAVSMHALKQQAAPAPLEQFFVKLGNNDVPIDITDISYLEADGKYVIIHLSNGKKYPLRSSLTDALLQIQSASLMQVHKSYVVNTRLIKSITYDELYVDDKAIPLGRSYREQVKKRFSL